MPIVSAKQKVRRERRSYTFAESHTVSPGEGSKCTASLQDEQCRGASAAAANRAGQDGAGRGRGYRAVSGLHHRHQPNYSKNQAFYLLFPMMARASCAERYGYLFSLSFCSAKTKAN